MQAPIHVAFVVCVGLCGAACDQANTGNRVIGPSPAAPSPSIPVERQPVQITSGADGTPVAGARVVIDYDEYYSGPNGQVEFDPYSGASTGASVDVDAPGFLPRKTRLTSTRVVTLWPVASDAEAEAVHEMVYRRGQAVDQVLTPVTAGLAGEPFYVTLPSGATSDTLAAWTAEATGFGQPFGMRYQVMTAFQYDSNEVSVVFGGAPRCAPIPTWGFCRVTDSPYEIYQVALDKARDPVTIRRVLASRFIGANPLPGLMSLQAPANQLSEFEARTVRMILLRPLPNRWPDTDR
jgi:hypothetical protein